MIPEEKPPENPLPSYRAIASNNGIDSEAWAFTTLNIEKISSLIDGILNGKPLEIKSCQKTIIDNSHSNKSRTGRFIFNEAQHDYLITNDGLYLFIVSENRQPCNPLNPLIIDHFFLLPASKIKIKIIGSRAITWTIINASR